MDYTKKIFSRRNPITDNPYMGFTSFQRFCGDPLYSDCVVNRTGNWIETESRECYPVPADAPQNGDSEGFYPDCRIAYIRFLWKEFEPARGEYNYGFVKDILDKAEAKGQSVMIRMMPHSTRACDDVPDWLKSLIPCPERPDGMRVKESPKDILFLRLFGEAVKKLGRAFDESPVLTYVDISLSGAWGEGSGIEDYPEDEFYRLLDIYIENFPHTELLAQFCNTKFADYVRSKRTVGLRADCLGNPLHMTELYPPSFDELSDYWKTGHVSLECGWWLGEWERRSWDFEGIIEKSLEWHISSFNGKSMPIPFHRRSLMESWLGRMGYHLAVTSVEYPTEVKCGDVLKVVFTVENSGVAPLYEKVPFTVRLSSCGKKTDYVTEADVRKWLPGTNSFVFEAKLDENTSPGKYDLFFSLSGSGFLPIRFENDLEETDGYYKAASFTVV